MLISVELVNDKKIIRPWSIISVQDDTKLGKVAQDLVDGKIGEEQAMSDDLNPKTNENATFLIFVSDKKNGEFQRIIQEAFVSETVETFGRYIRFTIAVKQQDSLGVGLQTSEVSNLKMNAFNILMNNTRKLCWPEKYSEENIKKNHLLFNEFVVWLEGQKLGFMPSHADTGKLFCKTVTSALWYVDPIRCRLEERNCHMPKIFDRFFGYNDPQAHKHNILTQATNLDRVIDQPWIRAEMWAVVRNSLQILSDSLHRYLAYMESKREATAVNLATEHTIRDISSSEHLTLIIKKNPIKPTFVARYKPLVDTLAAASSYQPIHIEDFTPADSRNRRYYLDNICESIPFKCFMFSYSFGNNIGTYHFIWKASPSESETEKSDENNKVCRILRLDIPTFHTRAMRRKFISKCGQMCGTNIRTLRFIYRDLTGDASAADTSSTEATDERVAMAFRMEDPNIITDMRHHNIGRPSKYDLFFTKCKTYLETVVEEACHERRHGDQMTYLASAISVPCLLREVKAMCPEDTPIPSEQWLRLQFAPKNPYTEASLQFTGKLQVKFMVQSRLFRKIHEDDHYCAAIFKYLRQMAVEHRDVSNLVCVDDKHCCKVGEPGVPVAAVDRGRQVIVSTDNKFSVADHDFTKSSIIPSVALLVDIPSEIEGSFYRGEVFVGVKDHVFEPSSPMRHMAELSQILRSGQSDVPIKPVLFLYSDGGPDHRLTYLSVQASLIALFRSLDLDMLVAARTAPNASWRNPPERIMSILNLALNTVGLMRQTMDDKFETAIRSCNSMSDIREKSTKCPGLKDAFLESVSPVKKLLCTLFSKLSLKDRAFQTFESASYTDIQQLWSELKLIDISFVGDETSSAQLKSKEELLKFMEHCCIIRQYSFTIKKCGDIQCNICKFPRLPIEEFSKLHRIPDPEPDNSGEHYKAFNDVYRTATKECHMPSMISKVKSGHGVPFSPSAQKANTVKRVVVCTECEKPRVMYSERKLNSNDILILDRLLDLYQYSCGSVLQDLNHPDSPTVNKVLNRVFVRKNLKCSDQIEIAYYSSKSFPNVCIKCGIANNLVLTDGCHPQCQECIEKFESVLSRKRNLQAEKQSKLTAKRAKKQK